jgi:type IV secretion system protein VirD4
MSSESKQILIKVLPYILIAYVFNQLSEVYRSIEAASLIEHVTSLLMGFNNLLETPMISFNKVDLLVGPCGGGLIYLIVYLRSLNAKKYRKGVEYGSARWGNSKDIKPYIDPVFEKNVLLSVC